MLKTTKAKLLDIVELTEDLPEYGIKRGEQGMVVEVLDEPDEAYILEFADPLGKSLRLAYWVKPNQIKSVADIAEETFEEGINLLNSGNLLDAEREFRKAIRLKPDYLSVLHNSIVKSFEGINDWQRAITAMLLVFHMNPDYKIARGNLAIALQKYGIQMLNEEKVDDAMEFFQMALTLEPPEDILYDIRTNIATVFTVQGIREHENGQLSTALQLMKQANIVNPNERTRRNVGIAYVSMAQSFLDKGQFQDAIIAFHKAELTGVMSAESLNDYGVALAHIGEVKMAMSAFERALELSPDNETIQANLDALRNDGTTDLSKVKIAVEFMSNYQSDEIAKRVDFSMTMPTPTYNIRL